MSRQSTRTFSAYLSKVKKPEISGFSVGRNSPDFKECPREIPGLTEMREEERIRKYVFSMMGGNRTIAPHPEAVCGPDPLVLREITHPGERELERVKHVAKRQPGVAQVQGKLRVAGDDVCPEAALKLAEAHIKALSENVERWTNHVAKLRAVVR